MSTALIVELAGLLMGSGGLIGLVAYVLRLVKKSGQKQAEAYQEALNAENAKKAGTVMAEHRDAADAARRLRDGQF